MQKYVLLLKERYQQHRKPVNIAGMIGIFALLAIIFLIFLIKNPLVSSGPGITPSTPVPTAIIFPTQLQVVAGTVIVTSDGQDFRFTASQSALLQPNDIVTSQAESIAVIDYTDGTVVRLGPDSSLSFEVQGKALTIKQRLGNIYYRFKKILGAREELNVETATALAVVRGTKFGVFTSGGTKIVMTESSSELYQLDPSGQKIEPLPFLLDEGKQAEMSSDSAETSIEAKPIQLTASEKSWMDFNAEADKLYDQGNINPAGLSPLAAGFFTRALPTPTPTPAGPTATPTAKPVAKISEMLGTGYNTGSVQTDAGTFSLSCMGSNKNSVRVITDSANDSDCKNDCPVKSLQEFVQSNGGFAGMNGMYFCPADYPGCADKKNSFDTLLFNSRTHNYINSDNNVFSSIPFLVIEGSGNARFLSHSSEWGRDTGIMAGIAGNPLLVRNGANVTDQGSIDNLQRTTKTTRGAFVQKGDTFYLCIVKSATVPDTGKVYTALKVDNAINIDGGGSTAMYVNGGYVSGPGRAIPNAIIFGGR